MKRTLLITVTLTTASLAATGVGPAHAAPPEFPHGVGVCMSQIAIDPTLVGADHLGQAVSGLASPGTAGSGVSSALAGLRGDGDGGCGAPPGPGHLGG